MSGTLRVPLYYLLLKRYISIIGYAGMVSDVKAERLAVRRVALPRRYVIIKASVSVIIRISGGI